MVASKAQKYGKISFWVVHHLKSGVHRDFYFIEDNGCILLSEGASIKDILELRAKDNYSPSVLDFSSYSFVLCKK